MPLLLRRLSPLASFVVVIACSACGDPVAPTPGNPDFPKAEGEGDVAGEGEGDAGEGEGEGEGDAGEGEGDVVGEGEGEGEGDVAGEGEGEGEGEGDGGPRTASSCFADIASQTGVAPNYDQFAPTVGSHCFGTNHQDIENIERVVFLGDSVTVGTPPSLSSQIYRAILADRLADRFGIEPASDLWKTVNVLNGVSTLQHSGAFWSCAKWGARVDDLMQDNTQIDDCFPDEERNKHTLVIMTMGGNDIASLTKDGAHETDEQTQARVDTWIGNLRAAVEYMKDPVIFPGGVDIIFSNNFEFTDGTGDVASCPAASTAGFDEPWDDPTRLATLIVQATEQYMQIAVETQTDLVFTLETFCGHGYHNDDAGNACYRGPDTPRWFDLSCIHPNPVGHEQIADEVMAIVNE